MKWSIRPKINVYGEIRHINIFLLFPRTIGLESRWLEFVWITQVYTKNIMPTESGYWEDWCWGQYKKPGDSINY